MSNLRTLFILSLVASGLAGSASAQSEKVDFNRDIRPLLSDRCFHCHGPDSAHREADLRLDQAAGDESPFADRDGHAAITPRNLAKSSVWLRISTDDEDELMPPPDSKKPALTAQEKELIKNWILQGADFDTHWAFKSPIKPEAKKHSDDRWNGNRIDRFVFESLLKNKLQPKAPADRRTLIRRLSFDLTGLPPTIEEIREFLDDKSENAYEKLVDRLIARQSFGEHMARSWLDLVRFADTNGIHHDHYREVTPYRDWVIRSFNNNLPFDKFIQYQIAGDLFENPTTDQLVASGYNRLHLVIDRGTALPEESFNRNVVDRVNAFGTVFLGLTVQCAQCHEHKYDPMSQEEFYELYAFFNNIDAAPETPGSQQHPPLISVPTPQQESEIQALTEKLNSYKTSLEQFKKQLLTAKQASDTKKVTELDAKIKAISVVIDTDQKKIAAIRKLAPTSLVMKERKDVRETHMRIRGAYDQLGKKVSRGTPDFLPPLKSKGEIPSRLDLANWLTDPTHPLTGRVTVNRIWQQLFGVGLVKTSEDFGAQGQPPSHPELLDDLTLRFVESGWNVKQLVKEIVLSETYRQASSGDPKEFKRDPENRMLARGSRYRLDAETIRDQILMVSGRLNREMYGRSVKPPQPPNLWKSVSMRSSNTYSFKADTGEKILRRSLYSFWKRAMPPPQMTIFDAPTRESCIARRERTNTPLQALVLMNEGQYFLAAKHWAANLLGQKLEESQRIDTLYESLTAKLPDAKEKALILASLNELKQGFAETPKLADEIADSIQLPGNVDKAEFAAYTSLINSLFNLDIVKTRE